MSSDLTPAEIDRRVVEYREQFIRDASGIIFPRPNRLQRRLEQLRRRLELDTKFNRRPRSNLVHEYTELLKQLNLTQEAA